jgi:Zn finger protein HypA/HybF involved in hydrogenase expression
MAKQTVESSLILDVVELARKGCLADGSRFRSRWWQGQREIATFTCSVEDGWLDLYSVRPGHMTNDDHDRRDQVELTRTLTSFGAERVWFICMTCGRQVRKLYLPPGALHFRCRTCYGLTYQSRQTRTSIYTKALVELPRLYDELHTPWLSAKRLGKIFTKIEKLQTEYRKTLSRDMERLTRRCASLGIPDILTQGDPGEAPDEHPGPVGKRPPGRPKTKRAYVRQKPFTEGVRRGETEALCLRCRDFREMRRPQTVTLPNGRPALRGKCPVCGARMCQIISKKTLAPAAADISTSGKMTGQPTQAGTKSAATRQADSSEREGA